MALDADKMAEDSFKALSAAAGTDLTDQAKGLSKGLVAALKAASVTHAGSVVGSGAPAGPFQGAAMSGKILKLLPAQIVAELKKEPNLAKVPPSKIQDHATKICNYIMSSALVNFSQVTGMCGAGPTSPGPLNAGAAQGGKIMGLVGAAMAAFVGDGAGPDAPTFYQAICDHIMQNAECAYLTGSVIGAFAPGGGALLGGTGQNGTIK